MRCVPPAVLALPAALGLACAPVEPRVANPFAADTRVVLEVDVQPGAEPFTGPAAFGDTWDLTRVNLEALLGEGKDLEVPATLDDMGTIDDVPEGPLDVTELLALAEASLDTEASGEAAAYHVLFLDRFFEDDASPEGEGGERRDVLGVSIGDTRVIAMFKPVIGDGGLLLGDGVDRFVEQATMIHEVGHALGLVNNGLEMVRDHQDDNGAHCDDDRCVMFFLNEGVSDAGQFARDAIVRADVVLFDDDCLDDANAARGQ